MCGSNLTPEDFSREGSVEMMQNAISGHFCVYNNATGAAFVAKVVARGRYVAHRGQLWKVVEETVGLHESEIYSFIPDDSEVRPRGLGVVGAHASTGRLFIGQAVVAQLLHLLAQEKAHPLLLTMGWRSGAGRR